MNPPSLIGTTTNILPSTYVHFQVGSIYGEIADKPVEPIIVRFFGIFFLFFQSASIWGNLIASAGKGKKNNHYFDLTPLKIVHYFSSFGQ